MKIQVPQLFGKRDEQDKLDTGPRKILRNIAGMRLQLFKPFTVSPSTYELAPINAIPAPGPLSSKPPRRGFYFAESEASCTDTTPPTTPEPVFLFPDALSLSRPMDSPCHASMIVHADPSTPRFDDGDDDSLVQMSGVSRMRGSQVESGKSEHEYSSICAEADIDGDVSDVWLDDGKVEYRILDKIGDGSYGRVFAAEATPWDLCMPFPKQVAIKALSKKAMISDGGEFYDALTERLNLASCNDGGDPSITTLLSSFQDEQNVYLVMRLYVTDLETLLENRSELLPWEVICIYVSELVRGVINLRVQKIIHRDLKPANIFITPRGHLSIGDFGLAHQSVPDEVLLSEEYLGTLHYLAPEVCYAEHGDGRCYDDKVDSWALGLILAEIALGLKEPLFGGNTLNELAAQIRGAKMKRLLKGIKDRDLRILISKLLIKEPMHRLDIVDVINERLFRKKSFPWQSPTKLNVPANLVPSVKVLNVNRDLTPPPVDPLARKDPLASNANWNEFNWYCDPKHLVDKRHGELELRTMTRAEREAADAVESPAGQYPSATYSTERFEELLIQWSIDLEQVFQ